MVQRAFREKNENMRCVSDSGTYEMYIKLENEK
ncbi:hypothetical protein F383_21249 [Gossypium arboreum]|uniref:Uncharacterized protein n=1 Tax=Gossypium arboreum TaxID=29729 RepID=A0A0B0P3R1_GOSAR|nr:hypothetical protein F383_21249 [Gossypium arboreum]